MAQKKRPPAAKLAAPPSVNAGERNHSISSSSHREHNRSTGKNSCISRGNSGAAAYPATIR